jgi:aminoglycoside phosphotransferase (APT) family kinase protein
VTVPASGPRLDPDVLGRWLDTHNAPGDGEEPVLEQLGGGSQNTLYLIRRGGERMVLRMPGARADAARIDGLLREIRLVRALSGTDVPHAELIAADDAGDLLGMPFYGCGRSTGGARWTAAGRLLSTPT